MRRKKKSKKQKKNWLFFLVLQFIKEKQQGNTAEELNINLKNPKLYYNFGAALRGVGFELVIPGFLVDNTIPFEKRAVLSEK